MAIGRVFEGLSTASTAGANSGNMMRVRICMESMELATKSCPDGDPGGRQWSGWA